MSCDDQLPPWLRDLVERGRDLAAIVKDCVQGCGCANCPDCARDLEAIGRWAGAVVRARARALAELPDERQTQIGGAKARRKGPDMHDTMTAAELLRRYAAGKRDFARADFTNADLRGVDLRGASLRGADLTGVDLTDANLNRANLRGADLTCASLRGADLRGASLCGADLTDASVVDTLLRGADLRGADLTGVDLTDALLSDSTLMPDGRVWSA